MRKNSVTAFAIAVCLALFATAAPGQDKIPTWEFQVTFDSGGHSTPMVGKDSIGDLIVYSQYPIVNGMPGNASIYYQRVANGAPFGPAVTVADSPANQWLDDVSGDNIVYTISPSIGAYGNIVLYQISTAQARALTTASNAWEPRIFGDYVVWVEMTGTGGQVVSYQISSGTPVETTLRAGPSPSVAEAAVGDRFIVWSQFVNGRFEIAAYDMQKELSVSVASDPNADLRVPSTSGSWIAWESRKSSGPTDINAINMDIGGVPLAIASNGASNQRPHVSGDLISYESNVLGNWQIFLYRIAEKDTFRVTDSTYDEHLNDVLGNLVTYVDSRNGSDGVYATSFSLSTFVLPTANAGQNQTVHPGSLVSLDGSASSDPSGLPLTYAWSFTSVPNASSVTTLSLSDPTAVKPTFTPDVPGNYVIQLVVTNSAGAKSAPATVTISTINSAPIASAGSDQAITVIGATVQLDGSQSYDPDGDEITYNWSFVSKPTGSNATLSNQTIVNPTFIADVHGTYVLQLIVSDRWTSSAASTVTVSFTNVAPVANAGLSQSAIVGTKVNLNGSLSYDANGDVLTYQWSFTSVPQGSSATIASSTWMIASFVPDLPGTYVVQLVVNDGIVDSNPSTIQMQAVYSTTFAVQEVKAVETSVAGLNPAVLKNANMQNAFINKLNTVVANIADGNILYALDQLQNDILQKTDGCASTGSPDKNDWIKTCDAQNQVYPSVVQLIQTLQGMQQP